MLTVNGLPVEKIIDARFKRLQGDEARAYKAQYDAVSGSRVAGPYWKDVLAVVADSELRLADAMVEAAVADAVHLSDAQHETFWNEASPIIITRVAAYARGNREGIAQYAATVGQGHPVRRMVDLGGQQAGVTMANRVGERAHELTIERQWRQERKSRLGRRVYEDCPRRGPEMHFRSEAPGPTEAKGRSGTCQRRARDRPRVSGRTGVW